MVKDAMPQLGVALSRILGVTGANFPVVTSVYLLLSILGLRAIVLVQPFEVSPVQTTAPDNAELTGDNRYRRGVAT